MSNKETQIDTIKVVMYGVKRKGSQRFLDMQLDPQSAREMRKELQEKGYRLVPIKQKYGKID